jgi:hypothetical protein
MRNLTLSNKKSFTYLQQNINKPKRKRPIVRPETNEEIARRLQANENQTIKKQLENNETLARRLQLYNNQKNKTRRKPRSSK